MKKTFNETTGLIEFTFEGLDPVTLDPTRLSETTKETAFRHGLLQKMGDAAAILKTAENGYTVTEAMRRAKVAAMAEQLIAHGWDAPAQSRAPAQSPIIAALAAKAGVDYDTMAAKLANLDIEALMAQ